MGITWEELDGIKALYTRLAPNSIPSPPPSPPPPPPPPPQSLLPMSSWAAWSVSPEAPPPPSPAPQTAKYKLKLPGLVISGDDGDGGSGGSSGSRDRFATRRQGSRRIWEPCEKRKNVFDSLTEQEQLACFNNDAFSTQTGNFMFVPITGGGNGQKTTIRLQYLFDKK